MVNSMLAVDSGTKCHVSGIDTSMCTFGRGSKTTDHSECPKKSVVHPRGTSREPAAHQPGAYVLIKQCMHIRNVAAQCGLASA